MYSMQLPTPLPSISSLTWNGHVSGWNTSRFSTADDLLQQHSPFSSAPTVVHISVGATNASTFTPQSATINLGDIIRFHLPALNCSLVQTFDEPKANVSLEPVRTKDQILKPVEANGSLFLDYLVDLEVQQWVYPEHSLSCGSEGFFMIAPSNRPDIGNNSTQNQTAVSSTVQSSLKESGNCGSAPHTGSNVETGYRTGIVTDATASPTVRLPFATSIAPGNISKASRVSSDSYALLFAIVCVFPVLTKLLL